MAEKVSLFDDSDDSNCDEELQINKDYASKYDQWREKELLQRYKDLQEEISSTSSDSEDDVPEMDENFFRVLSLLKGQDPKIYDKNFVAFQEPKPEQKPKARKAKQISVKDYERKIILEKNGDISEEENEDTIVKKPNNEAELEKLKNVLMDDNDTDDEDCIKSVIPSQKENSGSDEHEGFIKYLKGDNADIPEDSKNDLSYLRNCWNDPNIDEDEKFLRDFFLNKTYLKKDDDFKVMEELKNLSEEEKIEEEQELFEHKYNFRFEEPDQEFIKRYPRTVGDSLRRKDTKRKLKRDDYIERKQKEKELKREELKRLKAVKRKEIEDKFSKLQEITGMDNLNLDEEDIESDFNPDKHDQKMKELFDKEFYSVEEEQKPVFSYDEEIDDEDWNHWTRIGNPNLKQESVEQENNDVDPNDSDTEVNSNLRQQFEQEIMESTQDRRRKGRKKSLFAKILSNPKPLFDPEGKSFDEYLEEYYKMDYEDIIGDMPVRFKYRKVVPNSFGLTVDEILKADDKDLNRWCSVKKTCQYRQEQEELYDVQAFQKKAGIPSLKQKTLPSLYSELVDKEQNISSNDNQNSARKKKRSKKKKTKSDQTSETQKDQGLDNSQNSPIVTTSKPSFQNESFHSLKQEKDRLENKSTIVQNTSFQLESSHLSKRKRKRSRKSKNSEIENADSTLKVKDTDNLFKNSMQIKTENLETNDESNKQHLKKNYICAQSSVPPSNKRKLSSENLNFENNETDDLQQSKQKKPKFKDSESNVDSSCHTESKVINDSPQLNNSANNELKPKKKHKKKKSKDKGNLTNNTPQYIKHSSSQNHKTESDKRLALSDERLAAYGINPKKFKNQIKYSKQ